MNRVVYKWTEHAIMVPTDHPDTLDDVGPFHVGQQRGQVAVWAEVNPEATPHPFHLIVRGTGEQWEQDGSRYLGTVPGDLLVWHIYLKQSQ